MKLLVIRPQPGADATALRIRAKGHEAIIMPLFEVQPLTWDAPSPEAYDALILTSGNALRMAGKAVEHYRDLPVYAVGSATAQAAQEAGLRATVAGNADAEALITSARTAGHRRVLWLAGEDRTGFAVPDDMIVDTRIVYRSAELPPPACFAKNVRATDATLLHSARAAIYFGQLCDIHHIDRSGIMLAAFSSAVAEIAGSGWEKVILSPVPTDATLLSEMQSYFTTKDCDP